MNVIIPKVQKWQINEFLQTLHPETIAEMWMCLCDYHRYDYLPFMWCELEDMILKNPYVAGIELVDFECDCGKSSNIEELVEDQLKKYPSDEYWNVIKRH